MNKITILLVFTVIVSIGTNIFQLVMNPKFDNDYVKVQKIIGVNGEIFDNFAKLTELTEHNTGTMMNFTHYLDKHDPSGPGGQVIGCPECGKFIPSTIPESAFDETPPELTEVEESLDQILADAKEVNHYISALIFTAINHDVTLRISLERMRDPDADRDGLYEKIYKPLTEYGIDPSRVSTVEEL